MSALSLLTNSRLKVARACQRRHHLMFNMGIRPVAEPEALRFGTLIHKGLEAWWKAAKQGLAGDALLLAMSVALASEEIDPFERVRLEEMLRGYHHRWQDTLQDYEVLAVELQFCAPLVNPQTGRASRIWELGGKIDALVRDLRSRGLAAWATMDAGPHVKVLTTATDATAVAAAIADVPNVTALVSEPGGPATVS